MYSRMGLKSVSGILPMNVLSGVSATMPAITVESVVLTTRLRVRVVSFRLGNVSVGIDGFPTKSP